MKFEDWGTIDYKEAEERQLQYLDEVAAGEREDTIILCNHNPVVTTGRATEDTDVFAWDGKVIPISRGGRATYHGPNQQVIYPIIDLNKKREACSARDLNSYLRALETSVIQLLSCFGLASIAQDTGVWVNDKKLASIGIAVKKWVTYHGVAINLHKDEKAFQGINPCGYKTEQMTFLDEVLDEPVLKDEIQEYIKDIFTENFAAK